jgi:plastocyanin
VSGSGSGSAASGSSSGSAAASGSSSGSASSSAAAQTPAFQESEADTRADYNLVDYKFEGPASVKGPRVWFTARNTGTQNHELEILDASGEALGEIEEFAPNANADPLAVELQPGTYTLQCILENQAGEVHKDLGMELKLTVT